MFDDICQLITKESSKIESIPRNKPLLANLCGSPQILPEEREASHPAEYETVLYNQLDH